MSHTNDHLLRIYLKDPHEYTLKIAYFELVNNCPFAIPLMFNKILNYTNSENLKIYSKAHSPVEFLATLFCIGTKE